MRQKESVGSHLDPFVRNTLTVPDHALNNAVLRGLDRAVATEYPESQRIFMAMRPDAGLQNALPQDREALSMRRVMEMLEKHPQRKDWDQIIVVVPKWLMAERLGMGSKLSGIGLYVQPLGAELDTSGDLVDDSVEDTAREQVRSRRFVAPFLYVQVTTLDAKTLQVIRSDSRYDFRRSSTRSPPHWMSLRSSRRNNSLHICSVLWKPPHYARSVKRPKTGASSRPGQNRG